MTSHELAQKLLAMPDIQVMVEVNDVIVTELNVNIEEIIDETHPEYQKDLVDIWKEYSGKKLECGTQEWYDYHDRMKDWNNQRPKRKIVSIR